MGRVMNVGPLTVVVEGFSVKEPGPVGSARTYTGNGQPVTVVEEQEGAYGIDLFAELLALIPEGEESYDGVLSNDDVVQSLVQLTGGHVFHGTGRARLRLVETEELVEV